MSFIAWRRIALFADVFRIPFMSEKVRNLYVEGMLQSKASGFGIES